MNNLKTIINYNLMNEVKKKMLVTCALPYANGPIHIGHILEHIQADIWVRYKRMRGHDIIFISADDAHGTPIMLKAQQCGITPEQMTKQLYYEHKMDFSAFDVNYDNYYSTHSKENFDLLQIIYARLKKNKYIKKQTISQFYDIEKGIFLPDRFVKGGCPKCKSKNQYGDNCEECGATYNSIELIEPKSIISNTTPVIRDSEHLFFQLSLFQDKLYYWACSSVLQNQVLNKILIWFKSGLKQWDISRDFPYFGFEIPDKPGKYFYVWLDAPIGYMSSFKNLCNKKGDKSSFNEYWKKNSKTELYHFIGKDIIYFHSIFWPAILEGSGFRTPTNIFVHGHLTVNGAKMSKSRGTLIKASTWLNYFDSDSLRYYFASKLSSSINDVDFNIEDFIQRINSDIVNKVVNLASRNASFINKHFNSLLSKDIADLELYQVFSNASTSIGNLWNNREFNKAITQIMKLADLANCYINKQAPWIIAKSKEYNKENLQNICSMGINLFRIIMIYLKPVIPKLAIRTEVFLNSKLHWNSISQPLINHKINAFKPLYSRIKKGQMLSFMKNLKKINIKYTD